MCAVERNDLWITCGWNVRDSNHYPQESAPRGDFTIEAKRASGEHELRVLILRDRERVNRKALSGRTVRRAIRPSGRVVQRTRKFEAERDIGLRSLRAAHFGGTQGLKAEWFERRQECSSEHVCWAPRPRTWRLFLCARARRHLKSAAPGRGAPPGSISYSNVKILRRYRGRAGNSHGRQKPEARRERVAPGPGRQELDWTRVHSTCARPLSKRGITASTKFCGKG